MPKLRFKCGAALALVIVGVFGSALVLSLGADTSLPYGVIGPLDIATGTSPAGLQWAPAWAQHRPPNHDALGGERSTRHGDTCVLRVPMHDVPSLLGPRMLIAGATRPCRTRVRNLTAIRYSNLSPYRTHHSLAHLLCSAVRLQHAAAAHSPSAQCNRRSEGSPPGCSELSIHGQTSSESESSISDQALRAQELDSRG